MIRSYRYRLRPTRAQAVVLGKWLFLTRQIYNAALQERRDAWQKCRVSVSAFDQSKSLSLIRADDPTFAAVSLVALRGVIRRLDRAFAGFFRRCKSGDTPGFPRFKSARHWNSLHFDDLSGRSPLASSGKCIRIPVLGPIRLKLHRPIEGTPKALRLTTDAAGRWYATLACVDVPAKPLAPSSAEVGVDLGLLSFAASSDGQLFENPRATAASRIAVERAARLVSRRERGSRRRRKAAILLALKHAHVAAVRRENHIGVAKALVARYGAIFVEGLNIKGLARGFLAKSVNDAGWGNFLHWLRTKAEEAGREVVEVDPRGTSQTCPKCASVKAKPLSERVHRCDCGLVLDRDVAAAQVILGLGMSLRGAALAVGRRQRSEKCLPTWSTNRSRTRSRQRVSPSKG